MKEKKMKTSVAKEKTSFKTKTNSNSQQKITNFYVINENKNSSINVNVKINVSTGISTKDDINSREVIDLMSECESNSGSCQKSETTKTMSLSKNSCDTSFLSVVDDGIREGVMLAKRVIGMDGKLLLL